MTKESWHSELSGLEHQRNIDDSNQLMEKNYPFFGLHDTGMNEHTTRERILKNIHLVKDFLISYGVDPEKLERAVKNISIRFTNNDPIAMYDTASHAVYFSILRLLLHRVDGGIDHAFRHEGGARTRSKTITFQSPERTCTQNRSRHVLQRW